MEITSSHRCVIVCPRSGTELQTLSIMAHMPQHAHGRAFTPVLHQSSTIPPAPPVMGTQDSSFNTHLPRRATRPCSAPVTAFHRAARRPSTSPRGGRWAALHVCIAWKIYYHKQLKKMQHKANSVYGELRPERVTEQRKEPEQASCTRSDPDSPCGQLGIRSGAGANTRRFNRQDEPDEKEKHGVHAADAAGGSTVSNTSRDRTVTAELDRKRQLECDRVIQVKRMKKEAVDDEFGSSATFHPDQASFSMRHSSSRLRYIRHNSSTCNVGTAPDGLLCYPGAEICPNQTASWEPLWDVLKTKDVLRDYSVNTCKAVRHEAFSGFFMPPLYMPPSLGVQETAYLTGREFLHSHQENFHFHRSRSQLHHPGFMAASCLTP